MSLHNGEYAQVMHGGQLLTVFSARNYLDLQSNDSALLLIAYDCDGRMRIRPKRLLHREGTVFCVIDQYLCACRHASLEIWHRMTDSFLHN